MRADALQVLADLRQACQQAIDAGQDRMSITMTQRPPPGFPRRELLSVGAGGHRNYSVCPVRMRQWLDGAEAELRAEPL